MTEVLGVLAPRSDFILPDPIEARERTARDLANYLARLPAGRTARVEVHDPSTQLDRRLFTLTVSIDPPVPPRWRYLTNSYAYFRGAKPRERLVSISDVGVDWDWGHQHISVLELELDGHVYVQDPGGSGWILDEGDS